MQLDYDTILEPALFWFWNVTPRRRDIERRLDDILAKGVKAVYVHPMPDSFRPGDFHRGMEVAYLSDEYFDLIAHTCEQMRQREMLLWLYDEGGWPSGMAGGAVVATDPAYSLWTLARRDSGVQPVQPLLKFGYPDLMNPEATQCFIEKTHERYRQFLGHEFGRTVRGIFTDEPRLAGRIGTNCIPWSPLVPDAFEKEHGYPLEKVLPRLFDPDPIDDETGLIRRAYLHTISTLIANNYYRPIRQWCDRWNLLFEGHHSGEDEFSRHGQVFGDFMQQARHYHIPGVDTIWRQIFPGKPGGNYVGLASSISWLRGERLAVSESFSVYGSGLTLEQMHWVTAFQIVRGVNKIGFMPIQESVRGERRIGLCTDISPRTPIWRDLDMVVDFVREAARFSASGQAQPRIGVFYRTELIGEEDGRRFDEEHEQLCEHIHDSLASLIFLGIEDLRHGVMGVGGLKLGPVQIAVLVLHATLPLTADESEVLSDLANQGLRIIWVGDEASWTSFSRSLALTTATPNIQHLKDISHIDLSEYSPLLLDDRVRGVRLLPLREDEEDRFLFFNENSYPVTMSFRLRRTAPSRRLIECPLEHQTLQEVPPFDAAGGVYTLHLDAGQMRALASVPVAQDVASREIPLRTTPSRKWQIHETRPLDIAWKIEEEERFVIREDVEVEQPKRVKFAGELGDYSQIDPAFSGSLLYHADFCWEYTKENRIILDLGDVSYSAEVFLNGRSCGRRAWSPFCFDITESLRDGLNRLQVRVTNTLANQWARPDIEAQDFKLWKNSYLEKTSNFLSDSSHSGLIGPIRIHLYSRGNEPQLSIMAEEGIALA
jgi:hypothetical protein